MATGAVPARWTGEIEQALLACASGDQSALRRIYDAESARMLGVAQRLLKRRALAEEAGPAEAGQREEAHHEDQQLGPVRPHPAPRRHPRRGAGSGRRGHDAAPRVRIRSQSSAAYALALRTHSRSPWKRCARTSVPPSQSSPMNTVPTGFSGVPPLPPPPMSRRF